MSWKGFTPKEKRAIKRVKSSFERFKLDTEERIRSKVFASSSLKT